MNTLFAIIITLIPIFLWGVYFYFKNPRKQPISEIVKIFLLGTLSIVPVFIFHRYFLERVSRYLVELLSIPDISIVLTVLELGLMVLFIITFIFLFTLIQCTALFFTHELPWRNNLRTIYKKMYHLTPLLLFFFLFLVIEITFNLTTGVDFILSLTGGTIILAVLEEYFKYIINPFLVYKRLNSVASAIVNTVYIGLAFAFIENILYFINIQGNPNFIAIYVYRSLFTTLIHVSASGILGYFYGLSLFSKPLVINYEIEKSQYKALERIRNLLSLRKKSVFQNISVTQGFIIAGLVHAVFNLMILLDYKIFSAVFVIILSFLIVHLLNLKDNQVQYGLVGTATMPEEDFEKLRLQISVAQHLKEIQSAEVQG